MYALQKVAILSKIDILVQARGIECVNSNPRKNVWGMLPIIRAPKNVETPEFAVFYLGNYLTDCIEINWKLR